MPCYGYPASKRDLVSAELASTQITVLKAGFGWPDRKAGLDSGLDSGLDFGLDSGLDFGLTFIDLT